MNSRFVFWRILFFYMFMSICSLHASTIRIMGVGDSITEGGSTFCSYLGPLSYLLGGAGFHCEFVGPRDGSSAGQLYKHSAFGGKNAEFIEERIDSIYKDYPADIVLIHSGHNHFIEENPVQGIVEAHRSIIQKIRKINPRVVILVAGVINSGKLPKYSYIPDLNVALEDMVRHTNSSNVMFVNVSEGFDWQIHTIKDRVHPNLAGAYVMACNWFKALTPILLRYNSREV